MRFGNGRSLVRRRRSRRTFCTFFASVATSTDATHPLEELSSLGERP